MGQGSIGRHGFGLNIDRRGILAGLATAAAASAAGPALARAAPYPALQALIDAYVAEGLVPGAVVGVVRPGRFAPSWMVAGRTAFEGGSAVSPSQTLWRIFSMTKQVTGIAVMQQMAAGKIGIDTPIADIMPEFRTQTVLVDPAKGLESRPAKSPILVRHLLTHTAGFGYTINGDGPLERAYRQLGLQPMSGSVLISPEDPPAVDLTTYMQRLSTLPLLFDPGTKWHYSIGLDVAGALLERLTGKTLDRVFADQLFGPLAMRDTGFWVSPAQQKRLAVLYSWRGPGWKPIDKPVAIDGPNQSIWAARPTMLAGGAGLVSSAQDFARFVQMLLNDGIFEGRAILPRGVARLAMSNLLEPGTIFADGQGFGAGGRSLLWETTGRNPEKYGVGTWGWGGAASTVAYVDPVRQIGVVLMLQSLGNDKGPNDERLNRAVAADSRI